MDNVTPAPVGAQITGTEYTVPSLHGVSGRRKGARPRTLPTHPLQFTATTPTTSVAVSAEAPREDGGRYYADVTLAFAEAADPEVTLYVNAPLRVQVDRSGGALETTVHLECPADVLPALAAALAEAVKRAQALQLDAATRAQEVWQMQMAAATPAPECRV